MTVKTIRNAALVAVGVAVYFRFIKIYADKII